MMYLPVLSKALDRRPEELESEDAILEVSRLDTNTRNVSQSFNRIILDIKLEISNILVSFPWNRPLRNLSWIN